MREVREWHVNQRGWSDIGYAFIIRRDGKLELGRDMEAIGAHVAGYNSTSVGIALVGGIDENGKAENNFNPAQFETLETVVRYLLLVYPGSEVLGHRDFPHVNKDCPCFDVRDWWRACNAEV